MSAHEEGEAPAVSPATRAELVALVVRIQEWQGGDEQLVQWLDELSRKTPHPAVMDLIFQEDLPAEEVVERALAYRPIRLGPGS